MFQRELRLAAAEFVFHVTGRFLTGGYLLNDLSGEKGHFRLSYNALNNFQSSEGSPFPLSFLFLLLDLSSAFDVTLLQHIRIQIPLLKQKCILTTGNDDITSNVASSKEEACLENNNKNIILEKMKETFPLFYFCMLHSLPGDNWWKNTGQSAQKAILFVRPLDSKWDRCVIKCDLGLIWRD